MEQKKQENNLYIVGVGASAGGLEALEKFFTNMPSDAGIGFVVVQHLSPDYKSLMVEILSKHTSMKVLQVEDGMEVEPNCVYLIPRKTNMTIFHSKLYLTDYDHTHGLNLPIDIFFRSLAQDQGERAISVILSGTGSDGTRGIRAIKETGGMVMVQDEESARFDGMPRSAVSTGVVDYILPPEKMPEELLKYIQHPYVAKGLRKDAPMIKDEDGLSKILAIIRNHSGVDFTYYKQSTVIRRIERRMSINQIENINDYLRYLHQSPHELNTLYKEMLIGVTKFFRDPEAFDILIEKIIPQIFNNKSPDQQIRIWVAGCSTGEEAYSIAILFREHMNHIEQHYDVKVFATDIDRDAIEHASAGIYPESIVADMSLERLKKFFVKTGESYQIARSIREMVIFAAHNLIKDPPFSKIDLISCRNLLIYLQPVLQKKVLSLFHFSLNPNGFLFLGTSETVGEGIDLFSSFDNKWKIYQYKGGIKPSILENLHVPTSSDDQAELRTYANVVTSRKDRIIDTIYDNLMRKYVPASILIDENYHPVHIFGDINDYVKLPSGKLNLNILKLIRQELSIALGTALHRVRKDKKLFVYKDVHVKKGDDNVKTINLIVEPVNEEKTRRDLILVIFEDVSKVGPPEDAEFFDIESKAKQRITDLEQELQYTKENLQATNEELQATNEELLAANEELQSTNEELQSVNEELITVNSEYQYKIQELTDLNNDMNNLLSSTNIGTIFLDKNLCVRRFTPAVKNEVHLLDLDLGRPLSHISHNFKYDNFVKDAEDVLQELTPREKEVQSQQGFWYLVRTVPYRTVDNVIKGVVITIVDITENKKAQEDRLLMASIVESSNDAIIAISLDGIVMAWNKGAETIYGYTSDEMKGKPKSILIPEYKISEFDQFLKNVKKRGRVENYETTRLRKDGKEIIVQLNISPIEEWTGEIKGASIISRDITNAKRISDELHESQQFLQETLNALDAQIAILDENGNIIAVNKAWNQIASQNALIPEYQEGTTINYLDLCDDFQKEFPDGIKNVTKGINQVMEGEADQFYMEYPCHHGEGICWFAMRVTKFAEKKLQRIVIAHENISLRKKAEEALSEKNKLIERIVETSPAAITMVDQNGQITFANKQAEQLFKLTRDNIKNRTYNAPEWHITNEDGSSVPDEELPFRQIMSTGEEIRHVRHCIAWPDGKSVLISINGAPLFDETNQVNGAVFLIELVD